MARLLFDQNLSPRLADVYPGSEHVFHLGLDRAPDVDVWSVARSSAFVIVSKDADFPEMATLRGAPPHVVWILQGNCSTADTEALLRASVAAVATFTDDPSASVLSLGQRR